MSPQEIIEILKTVIKGQAGETPRNPGFFQEIRGKALSIVPLIHPTLSDVDQETLNRYYDTAVKEYISVYPVDMDSASSLVRKGFRTWLTEERKATMPHYYFDRYTAYLRKQGRSQKVIEELSRASEDILGKLGDPESSEASYKRGLVVGSVQSGKTGNFNAVINRAIDAGYNLIIILSGIMEDLRSQTQLRLEEDVVGEGYLPKTRNEGNKGVGEISRFGPMGKSSVPQVISLTSHTADFRKTLADARFSLNSRNLLVCKKNTGVLKNLLMWLSDHLPNGKEQHDIPLLIIDDEADNASLNNLGHKGREYASTINGHIRAILKLFRNASYLGYTATPFANVLQDKNEENEGKNWPVPYRRDGKQETKEFAQVGNIYPDDFIELLSPPSNYIGAKQLFATLAETEIPKIPLIEPVLDYQEAFPDMVVDDPGEIRPATQAEIAAGSAVRRPRKDDPFPVVLPNSLKEAIECFILTIAVRMHRAPAMNGSSLYKPHHTMLIHVSRFIDWQNRTRGLVEHEVNEITRRIKNDMPAAKNSIYARLERTWAKYYAAIISNIRSYLPPDYGDEFLTPVSYSDIRNLLPKAVEGIEVKAINSITKDKLVYTTDSSGNGKKYIAIGGNRLSRGFTLEGLTVNYFLRDTTYADTLLQMGRWFGYRPGYIDCCKLFTTYDAIEKFDSTTRTIEELEAEFRKMQKQGKTPEDFIIRVKKDPGALKVTRPAILKNAVTVKWSYQDRLVQTTRIVLNATRIREAWHAMQQLFRSQADEMFSADGFIQMDTDVNGMLSFLNCTNSFEKDQADEFVQIAAFVKRCQEQNKLKKWRVAVKATGQGTELKSEESGLPEDIRLTNRRGPSTKIYRDIFLYKGIFSVSEKSANLISAGKDLSLLLDETEQREAELNFEAEQRILLQEKGIIPEEAEKKAREKTKPERVYRELMSEETGIFLIYLIDPRSVFSTKDGTSDQDLEDFRKKHGIDLDVPLIGYAIGFPPIESDMGIEYLRGDYGITEEEDADEYDSETLDANNEE